MQKIIIKSINGVDVSGQFPMLKVTDDAPFPPEFVFVPAPPPRSTVFVVAMAWAEFA